MNSVRSSLLGVGVALLGALSVGCNPEPKETELTVTFSPGAGEARVGETVEVQIESLVEIDVVFGTRLPLETTVVPIDVPDFVTVAISPVSNELLSEENGRQSWRVIEEMVVTCNRVDEGFIEDIKTCVDLDDVEDPGCLPFSERSFRIRCTSSPGNDGGPDDGGPGEGEGEGETDGGPGEGEGEGEQDAGPIGDVEFRELFAGLLAFNASAVGLYADAALILHRAHNDAVNLEGNGGEGFYQLSQDMLVQPLNDATARNLAMSGDGAVVAGEILILLDPVGSEDVCRVIVHRKDANTGLPVAPLVFDIPFVIRPLLSSDGRYLIVRALGGNNYDHYSISPTQVTRIGDFTALDGATTIESVCGNADGTYTVYFRGTDLIAGESFGLPAIYGANSGTPDVAFRVSSTTEQARDADLALSCVGGVYKVTEGGGPGGVINYTKTDGSEAVRVDLDSLLRSPGGFTGCDDPSVSADGQFTCFQCASTTPFGPVPFDSADTQAFCAHTPTGFIENISVNAARDTGADGDMSQVKVLPDARGAVMRGNPTNLVNADGTRKLFGAPLTLQSFDIVADFCSPVFHHDCVGDQQSLCPTGEEIITGTCAGGCADPLGGVGRCETLHSGTTSLSGTVTIDVAGGIAFGVVRVGEAGTLTITTAPAGNIDSKIAVCDQDVGSACAHGANVSLAEADSMGDGVFDSVSLNLSGPRELYLAFTGNDPGDIDFTADFTP